MPASNKHNNKKVGNRPTMRSGRPTFRAGPRRVNKPERDEFGLATNGKYASLGRRNRKNVAVAISEGFVYATTSGTTEEQCCYGELRRRGFTVGQGTSGRCFVTQFPVAGSVIDFAVWIGGEQRALRPQNQYWHGHAVEIARDDEKKELLEAAGWVVNDIWSGDSLSDDGIRDRFNLFFGS